MSARSVCDTDGDGNCAACARNPAYAHELAEKIRVKAREHGDYDGEAMSWAADLIDPEVSSE